MLMVICMKKYNSLSYDEKIDFFEGIAFDENPYLWDMANDADEDVRLYLAEKLANYKNVKSEQLLLHLISDQSDIIRANASDSIYWSESTEVLNLLLVKAKNDMYLVRGYAILSIADILSNLNDDSYMKDLNELYLKEKSLWTRMCYYQSFYRLGLEKYLDLLISSLCSKKYNYRIAAVNFLFDIVNETNKSKILRALNQHLITEKCETIIQLVKEKITKVENMNF